MQIISLNDQEAATVTRRDFNVSVMGMSPNEAVEQALAEHSGKPSRKFVEWLSDGRLTTAGGSITTAA